MDDTFLFLSVTDAALSNSHLNNLSRINDWVYKWKMRVDCDIAKPAHEVSFSQKKMMFTTLQLHITMLLLNMFNLTNI